jgi:hypothetical protein
MRTEKIAGKMRIIKEFQRFSPSVSAVIPACCGQIPCFHGTGNNREYLDMCGKTSLHFPIDKRNNNIIEAIRDFVNFQLFFSVVFCRVK